MHTQTVGATLINLYQVVYKTSQDTYHSLTPFVLSTTSSTIPSHVSSSSALDLEVTPPCAGGCVGGFDDFVECDVPFAMSLLLCYYYRHHVWRYDVTPIEWVLDEYVLKRLLGRGGVLDLCQGSS
jgi:hypothetical protein